MDNGRGFRAEQWARFCGRYTCAEMIETCARARLMEKGTSSQWSHDPHTLEKKTHSSSGGSKLHPVSRTRTAPLSGIAAIDASANGSDQSSAATRKSQQQQQQSPSHSSGVGECGCG